MLRKRLCVFAITAVAAFNVGNVQIRAQNSKESGEKKAKPDKAEIKKEVKETVHEILIAGKKIGYKAIAGNMPLKTDIDKPKASIFFIAYTRTDSDDAGNRPITFSFNGGPGSSSVWLHLGLLGPRRVLLDDEGWAPAPPYQLIDNEYSLLDKTDLVFIDPVSTGYSRAVEGEDPKQFHGIHEDIESVGEFIRLYLTNYKRWSSPKFLIGESYGTTRAAGLAGYLQDQHGIFLNGIMLVSSILSFQTTRFAAGNDLPYILFLPTYTATAWYHGQLGGDLQSDLKATLQRAEEFARGDYATALIKGDELPEAEHNRIVQELSGLTGLTPEYIEQTNLRIAMWRFAKELLRDQRRTTGRLDSRFLGIDADAAGESYEFDPSYSNILGAYAGCLNDYVRRELEFESELPYEILTGKVHPWNYDRYRNRYVNVAETLREAITQNPHLKVFVANGYYDMATPYFATEYTFSHLGLDRSLQDNVSMAYYEAGHMMYIQKASLIKMKSDLAEFIDSAK